MECLESSAQLATVPKHQHMHQNNLEFSALGTEVFHLVFGCSHGLASDPPCISSQWLSTRTPARIPFSPSPPCSVPQELTSKDCLAQAPFNPGFQLGVANGRQQQEERVARAFLPHTLVCSKHHGPWDFNNRSVFSHDSRGWKFSIKVLAWLVSSETPLLGLQVDVSCCPFTGSSSVYSASFASYKDTRQSGLESTLTTFF